MSTPLYPPARKEPRTLVLCFDGTSNEYASQNTNVVKLFSLLKKDQHQLCYYQAGIGTYLDPGVLTPMILWSAKLLDQAVAWYLDSHVMAGYKFIMQNYHPGDKICLFGFSRGAYTARALAGMLHKVGLLPRDNMEQVPFAYKMYARTDEEGVGLSEGFKQTYCREVKIEFLGVWDTVASVGMVVGRTLPFTTSTTMIKTFRHALSLDEHRAKFRPTLNHRPAPIRVENSTQGTSTSLATVAEAPTSAAGHGLLGRKPKKGKSLFSALRLMGNKKRDRTNSAPANGSRLPAYLGERSSVGGSLTILASKDKEKSPTPFPREKELQKDRIESGDDKSMIGKGLQQMTLKTAHVDGQKKLDGLAFHPAPAAPVAEGQQDLKIITNGETNGQVTDVLEVWFAGCHSDIGGGATEDSTQSSLSDITLRWMVREIAASQCGISFDTLALQRNNIPMQTFKFPSLFRVPPPCDSPECSAIHEHPDSSHNTNTSDLPAEFEPCGEPAVPQVLGQAGEERKGVPNDIMDGTKCRERARTLDLTDSADPIHDELKLSPMWWMLEMIPLPYSWQDADGVWHKKWGIHKGKGRSIRDTQPRFHTTVRERMMDSSLNYTPKATLKAGTPIFVD
ncbi:hypothetical protein BD410DRAFT_788855 [Rickenella mellea]|uniref:T6SS Phospholipase effector Tle1-like catalytic domain-containing protein n=1 Tax=Rickenella mellea TaxID=50990 RepID=A0A4Y7Q3C6_9AGAM|nr:hypothetical protein BD410DRAFT_788855 [Rickenella mellea]